MKTIAEKKLKEEIKLKTLVEQTREAAAMVRVRVEQH